MYNVLVVKVSVVGISCFSGLRLASGYSLNWLPVTERFKKKIIRLNFGLMLYGLVGIFWKIFCQKNICQKVPFFISWEGHLPCCA